MSNPKVKIANPTCRHAMRGFVSWPLVQDITSQRAHASTYCCDRQACIDDAALWVEAHTGVLGVYQSAKAVKEALKS